MRRRNTTEQNKGGEGDEVNRTRALGKKKEDNCWAIVPLH